VRWPRIWMNQPYFARVRETLVTIYAWFTFATRPSDIVGPQVDNRNRSDQTVAAERKGHTNSVFDFESEKSMDYPTAGTGEAFGYAIRRLVHAQHGELGIRHRRWHRQSRGWQCPDSDY
jgi:hypothetical protein